MLPVIKEIGIPGYKFIGATTQPSVRLLVEVKHAPKSCPYCEGGRRPRSKGRYQRTAKHLDLFGRPTEIVVRCRRFKCWDCGRSFVQPLVGIMPYRRSTQVLRERVYRQHDDGICGSTLARIHALGQATVSRIYAQFTARKAVERKSQLCPLVMGIDEHSLHRKQRFATTLCDLKNHKVFDVIPGKSEAEIEPYLRQLKGRERVRVVCIDMSSSYRAIIRKCFPRAIIVADRFHVVRLAMLHLLKICRNVHPQLAWKRSWLNLLRTRGDRLDPQQAARLRAFLNDQPVIGAVYEMKERLCALLCLKTQKKYRCLQLIRTLLTYIEQLRTSSFPEAQTLGKTLHDWQEEIVRMWRFSKNNGITEGFHRKMKLIQRRAYGIKSFDNYRLRVIAQCG
jgi:transposase